MSLFINSEVGLDQLQRQAGLAELRSESKKLKPRECAAGRRGEIWYFGKVQVVQLCTDNLYEDAHILKGILRPMRGSFNPSMVFSRNRTEVHWQKERVDAANLVGMQRCCKGLGRLMRTAIPVVD